MTILYALIAAIVGGAVGAGIGVGIASLLAPALGISSFEGAAGYFTVFIGGPLGGLLGLMLGAVLVLRRRGHRGFGAISGRVGLVFVGVALVAAAVVGYFYLSQDILNPNGGAPRLVFEIRLPAGASAPTDNERPIQLETSKNRMPALMERSATRDDGGRSVLVGTVEMYYRISSRLLTMTMPDKTDLIFNLKLGSAPKHSREFSPWERAERIVDPGKDQPRRTTPADNYEIRYRTEWPGED
jgi:hypothetical protein